jgi:hypothetical protein
MENTLSRPQLARRPVAVTVLAIIGIIYAVSGLAGVLQSVVYIPVMQLFSNGMMNMSRSLDAESFPALPDLFGGILPGMLLLAAIELPVSLLGLITCSAALKRKPWSRTGMIAFVVLLIVQAAVAAIALFVMINPFLETMERLFAPTGAGSEFGSSFISLYSTFVKFALAASLPLNCILPAIALVILNKPAVKQYYRELPGVAG